MLGSDHFGLNPKNPWVEELMMTVADSLGEVYPEIHSKFPKNCYIIQQERDYYIKKRTPLIQ